MRLARPVLTTQRRLGAGPMVRSGSLAAYRSIAKIAGEPHMVRTELVDGRAPLDIRVAEPVACIAHLTDLHVTDAQSPARFEFVNREWQDPRFRELLTMQRPQEMLTTHAIDAMVRTLNRIESGPVTGLALQLVAMTGDAIDNTQHNELVNFLALMNGGTVRPDSGRPGYEGVQLPSWPSADYCWKPDGPKDGDMFQSALGFPAHPGLLEKAVESFECEGVSVPWLRCYGNHEQVCQGVGLVTTALAEAMVGSRKPIELPPSFDRDQAVETFVRNPELFMNGPSLQVTPDPERRPISRAELVEAPYVHDVDEVRFITLDTVCDRGGADGTIDVSQLGWLHQMLEEARDRYVVIVSHHGFERLSNPRCESRAHELLDLLQNYPSVVLWLNGHIHANRIRPRLSFWEVTTSAIVDWPCQARLAEIFRTAGGSIAIACTMIDHDGSGLAGLHRELAANVPFNGFDSWRAGSPTDRNAILLVRDPL